MPLLLGVAPAAAFWAVWRFCAPEASPVPQHALVTLLRINCMH